MIEWEFNSLPVHVLVVHVTVVLVPLAAVCAMLSAVWPAARRRLGLATPALALAAVLVVPVTIWAGEWLKERVAQTPLVERHAELGPLLLWWTLGLFVTTALQHVWHRASHERGAVRGRGVGIAIAVAVVIAALGSIIMVAIIGESGAAAVWMGNF